MIEYNKIDLSRKLSGMKGSTTGTVYGVYDMAGGSWECIAGCIEGKENETFGVIREQDKKYVDLYKDSTDPNTSYDRAKIGDATEETKSWNGDHYNFVYSSLPVFIRGRWLQSQ